jgi:hypothetical protein
MRAKQSARAEVVRIGTNAFRNIEALQASSVTTVK